MQATVTGKISREQQICSCHFSYQLTQSITLKIKYFISTYKDSNVNGVTVSIVVMELKIQQIMKISAEI